ncbi:hypothetical protein ARALYDRAFT_331170 [Arabidopsis lyrata subsp. lyrata]|uniref:Uncharacterized protein n=1 Tax=Arabidopsis lyrata subsp. lyrata TaxID=81972 RepID=D7MTG2_ARALL|nr:hypothetical protein ARALYDRAFT_331170 [Arabidopsis lyrata subsp. lyrata]
MGITVDPVTHQITASTSELKDQQVSLMNKGTSNNEGHTYSETYGDEMPKIQVPETQENEEVYHVNIDDNTRPSTEFTHEYTRQNSPSSDPIQISASRVQQRSRERRGITSQRYGGYSRVSIAIYAQLHLTKRISTCDLAVKIFEAMDLPTNTKYYWECIKAFRKDEFWPLKHGHHYESPSSACFPYGNPMPGGFPYDSGQWGAPPNAPRYGAPPNAPQWVTPPNGPQWISSPKWRTQQPMPNWGTPPNGQQWGSSSNGPSWSSPSNVP